MGKGGAAGRGRSRSKSAKLKKSSKSRTRSKSKQKRGASGGRARGRSRSGSRSKKKGKKRRRRSDDDDDDDDYDDEEDSDDDEDLYDDDDDDDDGYDDDDYEDEDDDDLEDLRRADKKSRKRLTFGVGKGEKAPKEVVFAEYYRALINERNDRGEKTVVDRMVSFLPPRFSCGDRRPPSGSLSRPSLAAPLSGAALTLPSPLIPHPPENPTLT